MVSGVPGKPVTFNDGELSVDRVRVGTVLTQNDEVRDLQRRNVRGGRCDRSGDRSSGAQPWSAELVSKNVHYKTYGLTSVFTQRPVSKTSTDTLCSKSTRRIEGLTLEMWRNEVISGYQQRVRIPLASPQPTPTSGATPRAAQGYRRLVEHSTRPIP